MPIIILYYTGIGYLYSLPPFEQIPWDLLAKGKYSFIPLNTPHKLENNYKTRRKWRIIVNLPQVAGGRGIIRYRRVDS